jgi:hypothetical protein
LDNLEFVSNNLKGSQGPFFFDFKFSLGWCWLSDVRSGDSVQGIYEGFTDLSLDFW